MLRRRSVENRSSLGRATLDLPVAEPRTDLASWRAAYPQRFSITGRLRLVSHTWRLVQEVLDPLPDGLARTRLSLCRVAPEGRPPAGAPLADVDRPSYRHPSPS